MKLKPITKGEQFIYDWQYKRLGGFYNHLVEAISVADNYHLNLLHMGFPDEVQAYKDFTCTRGWWPEVEERIINRNLH